MCYVFLMDEGELVKSVVGDVTSPGCFPNPMPSRINVRGGSSFVRKEIISRMSQKYVGSYVGENLIGAYDVNLAPFIQRHDPSFC